MRFKIHRLNVLIVSVLVSFIGFSQTNEEREERANKLFEEEQYVEATKDYLHLLSLKPLDHDLNFRYGTCLLYNSNSKFEGIRYLKYAVQDTGVDPRAFYFYGLALHLNYQFAEAQKHYGTYLNLSGSKADKRYPVDRQIQMCTNGKQLLTTFTDIIVAEKKEIGKDQFFRIYTDAQTIGGEILVTAKFQSKVDKKMGHMPIVHFPPNAQAIYYSSYGEVLSNGLDIYIRRKLPSGEWGDAQLLPGNVNTRFDEDFPYMHPSGDFLYFSSTGHNSMGGYDVYLSKFDPNTNGFRTPENVDFAISSPDDDFFYVVDENFENAYFASARQSKDNFLHVYKVKVARVPLKDVIIMGEFISEVNPDLKGKLSIDISAYTNNQAVGKTTSNQTGKYSYVFPQGGKYNYQITVNGLDNEFKFVVELPFLDELRPLKQRIVHTVEDGEDILRIENLFDEEVEGADAIIAEVIRKKSELDVNIDKFDLKEIETESNKNEILASLGFQGYSTMEIESKLGEIIDFNANNELKIQQINSNIDSEILAKIDRIEKLVKIEQELTDKAMQTDDPLNKHRLLKEALSKQEEKEELIATVDGLNSLRKDVENKLSGGNADVASLNELKSDFSALVRDDKETEALNLLAQNKDLLENAKAGSPEAISEAYLQEVKNISEKITSEDKKKSDYNLIIEEARREINRYEGELITAKKKDQPVIEKAIADNKEEIQMAQEEIERSNDKISELRRDLVVLEEQIASLQNAIHTDELTTVDENRLNSGLQNIENIASTQPSVDLEKEIERIEEESPALFNTGDVPPYDTIKTENTQRENSLNKDPSLTELEKASQSKQNNLATIKKLDDRLIQIKSELDKNNDPALESEKEMIENFRQELLAENKTLDQKINDLKSNTPDAALTSEDLIEELLPGYQAQIDNIGASENDPKTRLEETIEARKELDRKVSTEISAINKALERDPENPELNARKEILASIVADLNEKLESEESELAQLKSNDVVVYTEDQVLDGFSDRLKSIQSDSQLPEVDRLKREKQLNEEVLAAANQLIKDKRKEQKSNPENQQTELEITALTALINEKQNTILQLTEQIDKASVIAVTEKQLTPEDLIDDYQEQLEEAKRSGDEATMLTEQIRLDEKLLSETMKLKEKKLKELDRSPDNEKTKVEVKSLEAFEAKVEASLVQLREKQQALESVETLAFTSTSDVKEKLDPSFDEKIEQIENDAALDKEERRNALLKTNSEMLDKVRNEIASNDQALSREPGNSSLQENKRQLSQFREELQNRIETLESADVVTPVASVTKDKFLEDMRNSYMGDASALTTEAKTEGELKSQDNLLAAYETLLNQKIEEISGDEDLANNQRKQNELKWLREESAEVQKKRRAIAVSIGEMETVAIDDKANSYKTELRTDAIGDPDLLAYEPTTLEELKDQDSKLEKYEGILDQKIENLNNDINLGESESKQEELEWLEEERDLVLEKRRKIRIGIGELETIATTETTNSLDDEKLNSLKSEEIELREKVAVPNITKKEKKQLEKALQLNIEDQNTRENELISQQIESENSVLAKELNETASITSNQQNVEIAETINAGLKEQQERELKGLEAVESEEEKNFRLNEMREYQEQVVNEIREMITDEKINHFENQEGISLSNKEQLEQKRRRFMIQIGDLTTEIVRKEREIVAADSDERQKLEKEKELLEERRELTLQQLKELEAKLASLEDRTPLIPSEATNTEISFNDERKLAATEEYKVYQEVAVEALSVEGQITTLEDELGVLRAEVVKLLNDNDADQNEIRVKTDRIRSLEEEVDRLGIKLTQLKYQSDQLLPADEEEAMKIQNLVARGVRPIQTTAVAAALLNLPTSGLAIDSNAESVYSTANPIPVNVESLSGLVYRVQIGAFARPIPQDLFTEFNPVSGEKIEGSNITRYMAGYFNSADAVVTARESIRSLGYTDAFVVAYCNGERVAFGEARRLEAAGICVPKRESELMIEVAEKTAKNIGLPLIGESVVEVDELSYHRAPGAADAQPIEAYEGLFFTVQIGVYNSPVEEKDLKYMSEILTIRLPNGQIRYSSGMFDSAEEALPRRSEALMKGVNGAFITAYYKGERISVGNARKILNENGPQILQSNINKKQPVAIDTEPTDLKVYPPRTDTVSIEPVAVEIGMEELRVQIVTKETFQEFPRDILNRYNAEGSFYYDENDKKVKSIIYKNADYLPRLYNFRKDIDTVYIAAGLMADEQTKIVAVHFADSVIPGDMMDWLLRFNYRRSFTTTDSGLELKIFGVEAGILDQVMEAIRNFGLLPEVKEETELELELIENK